MKPTAQLLDADTHQVLIETLEIADTIWTRFWGLMFRKAAPPSYGLLIQPCRSIHTMWMRMPIDVYFLSQDKKVLGLRTNLRPWRIAFAPRGTTSVLETPAGQTQLTIATKLSIHGKD